MISKTEFFEKHGPRLVTIAADQADGGDFLLFHPEEKYVAYEYLRNGYLIASVFDCPDDEYVVIDCDISDHPFKAGYLVLTKD